MACRSWVGFVLALQRQRLHACVGACWSYTLMVCRYPDTPGQYPDSKWSYYYDSGGLYDQAHSNAAVPDANTTSLANPNASDFAWQRGYSWYFASTIA